MSHAINDWLGLTEICFGLVVTKRVDITKFHSTMFQEPYDEGFEEFARHGDVTKTSQSITPAMYNAAIAAAGTIEDGTGIEWHKSLNKASKGFAIGTKAQRLGKAMASGKEVQTADIMEFTSALRDFASPDAIGLHALSEVDDNYEPFIKCGWEAIDANVGGIPASRPLVVGGDTGLGKALPVNTLVLTSWGYVKIGDIKIGDYVIGSNGKPTKVVGVFPQGIRNSYEVTFTDGFSVECDEEHLWNVTTKVRKYRGQDYKTLTLKQIVDAGLESQEGCRWFIPMISNPVQLYPRDLLLHPYVMGALLGDGCFRGSTPTISCGDNELKDRVAQNLPTDYVLKFAGQYDYRITKVGKYNTKNYVKESLKEYGLWNKLSNSKFIPDQYKFNDIQARIELLQGLMDTDGYISADSSNISYCSVSEQLAKDVSFVVQSLGGRAVIRTKKTTGQLAYNVTISFPNTINPFSISKKADRLKIREKYLPTRGIESVELVEEKEMVCIAVDAPDQLYVIEHCIVTHNTFMQMRLTGAFLTEHPDALGAIYTLEMSDRAWRKRFITMFPEYEDVMERIYISKSAVSVPEIGIEVASIGAGFVGIDYMDYLIRGEISEAAWRRTNLQLNEICRTLEIPLCILHQFNANRYTDPVPQMKHFAWGTSSTNVAGMVITLAKFRNAEDVGDYIAFDDDRPMTMLFWKSGDGWVGKRGPLAVSLPLVKNLWADEAGRCQTIGDEVIVKKFRKGGKND